MSSIIKSSMSNFNFQVQYDDCVLPFVPFKTLSKTHLSHSKPCIVVFHTLALAFFETLLIKGLFTLKFVRVDMEGFNTAATAPPKQKAHISTVVCLFQEYRNIEKRVVLYLNCHPHIKFSTTVLQTPGRDSRITFGCLHTLWFANVAARAKKFYPRINQAKARWKQLINLHSLKIINYVLPNLEGCTTIEK